jgi:catechol 2,3-dioxygenase-like lactoylglutathione lyase family enzyme
MFTTIFPIITTPDLAGALAFYRDLLGATVSYEFPGPDGEPGYVGLELGTAHLGIGRDPVGQQGRVRASASGSTPPIATRPWNACAQRVSRSSRSRQTSRGVSGSRASPTRTAT